MWIWTDDLVYELPDDALTPQQRRTWVTRPVAVRVDEGERFAAVGRDFESDESAGAVTPDP